MAVITATAQAKAAPAGKAAPPPMNPFTRAAFEHTEPVLDTTFTPGSSETNLGTFEIPAFGYLRDLRVLVEASGGTGAVAVYAADAPFTALSNVVVTDVNGQPLYGPLTGYSAYLVHKWGGYAFAADPKQAHFYAAGTDGNLAYAFTIPHEIIQRNALGALANGNAASTYRLQLRAGLASAIWSTLPTTVPSIRVRVYAEEWTQPMTADARGVANATQPPALGTTQFWTSQVAQLSSGTNSPRVLRVGNYVRNLLMVARTTAGVRDDMVMSDPVELDLDGRQLHIVAKRLVRQIELERYGYVASQVDAGVYSFDFAHDFDGHPGGEVTDGWLPTTQATRLELRGGNFGAGTLEFLINDVAAFSGEF